MDIGTINSIINAKPQSQSTLEDLLPKGQVEVNEEQLFLAELSRQVQKAGGDELLSKFQEAAKSVLDKFTANKKRLQLEELGTLAVSQLVNSNLITKKVADKIIASSWTAAQLDDNPALWDSIDGPNDPTKAVASREDAITSVQKRLEGINSGAIKLIDPGSIASATAGSNTAEPKDLISGLNFLWKPVANSSGTASVLFSSSLGRITKSVEVLSADGKVLDVGRFTSYGDDGSRAKFVFSKRGNQFPEGCSVVITLNTGKKIAVSIATPGTRKEGV